MFNNPPVLPIVNPEVNILENSQRKRYRKPNLLDLGDLRSRTLGSSIYANHETGFIGREFVPEPFSGAPDPFGFNGNE